MTAFEDFVNLELPRRSATLLPADVGGFTGDPNLSVEPALNNAPEGRTYFWDTVAKALWHKQGPEADDWVKVGGGGDYLVVADVAARDALSGLSAGTLVYSQASGLVFKLADDLTTWIIVANFADDAQAIDPVLGFNVHKIYVETPANGGSDTAGEGTIAAPFATIPKALEAVRSFASFYFIIYIEVGPGTFSLDSVGGFAGPYVQNQFCVIRGSFTDHATIPIGSQTPVGLVAGKTTQFRTDIGAYAFSVVEGLTWGRITFAGFEDFPSYFPAIGSSASPNIDLVNSSAPFGDLIIGDLATTIETSAGQISLFGDNLTLEAVRIRPGSGFLSAGNTGFLACDLSGFGGSNSVSGGKSFTSCYFNIAGIQPNTLAGNGVLGCLIEAGTFSVLDTEATKPFSRNVMRSNGVALSLGELSGAPIGRGNGKLFVSSLDLEDGSGIIVDGAGSHFVLQGDISVGTADPVSRALLVQNGGFYQRAGGKWNGSTTGVPVVVDTQGLIRDMVASFSGTLANSSVPGDEVTVGGNAPAGFAGGPYTDFALGPASRGAIAR